MNGQSLLGTSHQEAVRALQNLSTTVSLLVCDGYNDCCVLPGKPANGLSTQVSTLLSIIRPYDDQAPFGSSHSILE